ncbi:Glu/Leu/Phe/Val dehydrogenase dimerization domain-containing protein [Streptomyces sparsogenes]|uniref:Glu/Leu/Phe/Val dehydrogenase dimerization domain-containing protein n=1 Tax=Streptomyces sparsogenes TaxID=67365 RepID=UPI0033D8C9DB
MPEIDAYWAGEQTVLCRDDRSGLRAVIAVDDTTLGPGLGGVRLASYPSPQAAATEAQRLAAAMTMKNALAGLPYGGAKSVIISSGPIPERAALMGAFGRFVARLRGTYIPGVDMGTTTEDLTVMATAGATVSCATTDPSPWTAAGVLAAALAAARHEFGDDDLTGRRVLVQGVGHVGAALARSFADRGARVYVADIDAGRAVGLAQDIGAIAVPADRALATPSDVFVPCARARVIDAPLARRLDTRIVVGAANDVLADDSVADVLAERRIVYVPDFVANAGGVVQIHALADGWDTARLDNAVAAIGDRVTTVLTAARRYGTPLRAAQEQARRIVRAAALLPV